MKTTRILGLAALALSSGPPHRSNKQAKDVASGFASCVGYGADRGARAVSAILSRLFAFFEHVFSVIGKHQPGCAFPDARELPGATDSRTALDSPSRSGNHT